MGAAYIAGDLAYYLDKRSRGFDRCIYMLGADHHGYVPRMMALCAAYGDEPGVNLEIMIGQLVYLVRNGEPVRMSKRAGTVVTMEDLVSAVGVDAARYALARSPINSNLDIDLEQLAKDAIAKLIIQKFKGHGMARLVDAILRAQGFTTYLSPEGPDKGIDILAGSGAFGFENPKIWRAQRKLRSL